MTTPQLPAPQPQPQPRPLVPVDFFRRAPTGGGTQLRDERQEYRKAIVDRFEAQPDSLSDPEAILAAAVDVLAERVAGLDRENQQLRAELVQAAEALRAVGKAALVVKPTLEKPYEDEPGLSPWTRFMEEPSRTAYNLGIALTRKHNPRAALEGQASDGATAASEASPRGGAGTSE